jgi:hypothetical protein
MNYIYCIILNSLFLMTCNSDRLQEFKATHIRINVFERFLDSFDFLWSTVIRIQVANCCADNGVIHP